ncbi:MAG: leucine-rich repeat protein [Muribaculaceae bacterium]|nr:leucine-rich repeat protein [Muribaculaceae bacterium]
MKKRLVLIVLSLISALLCGLFAYGCTKPSKTPPESPQPRFPEVVTAPAAGNIVLGETVGASEFVGEFSVAGIVKFVDPDFMPQEIGTVSCDWVFIPEDTAGYKELSGKVNVEVYRYRLSFEENGGFDIPDVYYNESYTLKNKPITCKNDYRFDGWSLDDNTGALIDFPHVFTDSKTLYAKYMTCTLDKLFFRGNSVELSWEKYWLNLGDVDGAAENETPVLRYTDDNPEDALGGDIVIPDMHDGNFLLYTYNFTHSNVTSIVFNNVTLHIDYFKKTKLRSVTIPNTLLYIDGEMFRGCAELKEIIYEGGESAIEPVRGDYGWISDIKFEYKLRIRDGHNNVLVELPSLERLEYRNIDNVGKNLWLPIKSITIPKSVEMINYEAFYGCEDLEEVIFEEGSRLQWVGDRAFAQCTKLKKIKLPESATVFASAFEGCESLEEIDITDEQIAGIARHLHSAYIDGFKYGAFDSTDRKWIYPKDGMNEDFTVNITRDAQYAGENAQGAYVHGQEAINLYIDKFDVHALTVLCHEFFHHFQQVLCYGVGDETWDSVPFINNSYFSYTTLSHVPPILILEKYSSEYTWEYWYNKYLNDYHFDPYLVDDTKIEEWKRPYVSLRDDESNFDEYWNQPFEADAREFASWFTGVNFV